MEQEPGRKSTKALVFRHVPDSWLAHVFRILGLIPSGPVAFCWWSLSSYLLTWPAVTVMRGRLLVSSVEEVEEVERCCTGELTAGE